MELNNNCNNTFEGSLHVKSNVDVRADSNYIVCVCVCVCAYCLVFLQTAAVLNVTLFMVPCDWEQLGVGSGTAVCHHSAGV